MFCCRKSKVFGYGVLPQTLLGILSNITLKNLKNSEFQNTYGSKSSDKGLRPCGKILLVGDMNSGMLETEVNLRNGVFHLDEKVCNLEYT